LVQVDPNTVPANFGRERAIIDPPWGRLDGPLFLTPTMNAAEAVAGCCWWSGLPIVGVFWLIESRELVIELAQQLGNPFG
jgi:hypothetical protein